jgi:CRP-like cAMP-binding protein/uncharacterized protein (DUF2249 family)
MLTQEAFDLRRVPVWERAALVLERADDLPAGFSFEFLMELDPRALISRLEQLRPGEFAFRYRNVGCEWHVTFTRARIEEGASTLSCALARSAVFGVLEADARARIAESCVERVARKGQTLVEENSALSSVGFLIDGALGVFLGAGSRERLLFHLFPLDTFGETEFLDGGLALGRTVVLSKTARYATIPYDVLRDVGFHERQMNLAFASSSAQRTRALATALAAQVSQPIIARVASALLPYAIPERGLQPALPPLSSMTQAQVAAAAGTVKEVAARAIAELERAEALRREHGHIRYLDRTKLLETIESA